MKKTGAFYRDGKCEFIIWAPEKKDMFLHIVQPADRLINMQKDGEGYFSATVDDVLPGARYFFRPEHNGDFPDPSSFFQPDGVHKSSAVVDQSSYKWNDAGWRGLPLQDLVLYELHVGTFTPEGTFEAIIPRLRELKELGVNALELMPVAQFPGNRNWGYDGVYLYAVQNSYGGPDGLKQLVDACHQQGICVFLDVVYNHLGPEGNYLSQFGPYFTHKYATPWGDAINYDDEWSDSVKEFFVGNALYWFEIFHIDGLRLDAVHTIFDNNAHTFWQLLEEKTAMLSQKLGRTLHLTAESDFNSPRTVACAATGGQGMHAQWLDDFHHALYVLLHPAGKGRYADFGSILQLAKAYKEGFVHSGEYVNFRKRRHGSSSAGISGERFIVFNQNHDQVGNRPMGERLCMLVDTERQKLAAAAVLLAPYIPMLFMGEEYADASPFFYFVSHSDKELIKAVREGRKREFSAYKGDGEMPDAQHEETFRKSKLQWHKKETGSHKIMWLWHKKLIELRRNHPALASFDKDDMQAYPMADKVLLLQRQNHAGNDKLIVLFNFSDEEVSVRLAHEGSWNLLLDSKQAQWQENPQQDRLPRNTITCGETFLLLPVSVMVYETAPGS